MDIPCNLCRRRQSSVCPRGNKPAFVHGGTLHAGAGEVGENLLRCRIVGAHGVFQSPVRSVCGGKGFAFVDDFHIDKLIAALRSGDETP